MNTPGWLTMARAASLDGPPVSLIFRDLAAKASALWLQRWICPACGWHRPEHAEGCEVVKQLGKV